MTHTDDAIDPSGSPLTPASVVTRHVQEVWNERRLDVTLETIDASYVGHPLEERPDQRADRGPARYVRAVERLSMAFPDLHLELLEVYEVGEIVVTRWLATGTHLGELPIAGTAIGPTGRSVGWLGIDVWRVSNGRIVESWSISDRLGLLRQVGVAIERPG